MALTGIQADACLRTLIISSSGGSGHLQAAQSKKAERIDKREMLSQELSREINKLSHKIKDLENDSSELSVQLRNSYTELLQRTEAEYQDLQARIQFGFVQVDLLRDWAPQGSHGVKLNDKLARSGDIKNLSRLIKLQGTANTLFSPSVFYHMVDILQKAYIEHVIDTQALCTKSICRAVRYVNWKNRNEILAGTKRKITITKVMTDMPTNRAVHFFSSIKTLSSKDKSVLTLETSHPLLELTQDMQENSADPDVLHQLETAFWQTHLGSIKHLTIKYRPFPIRPAFYNQSLTDVDAIKKNGLYIRCNHKDELQSFDDLIDAEFAVNTFDPENDRFGVTLRADDEIQIVSMIFGSTGGTAVFDYINAILAKAEQILASDKHFMILIFCGNHHDKNDLYSNVKNYIDNAKLSGYIPKNLHFIAMGAQSDLEIAPIFSRSNTIIFRSGGLTSMEIYASCRPEQQLLIHSQSAGLPKTALHWGKHLLSGMVIWEAGNACYLMYKKGAHLMNLARFSLMELDDIFNLHPTLSIEQTEIVSSNSNASSTYASTSSEMPISTYAQLVRLREKSMTLSDEDNSASEYELENSADESESLIQPYEKMHL